MSGYRLATGGGIDRTAPLSFRFDGRACRGFAGDTLASALLANGVDILGRSFKYHRPRGLWGAWTDEPNAIFDVRLGGLSRPNCPGTTTPLEDGMELRAVNAWPSARRDLKAGLDLLGRFLPAGFYYKTFLWPDWHLFEPAIRRMAGLGRLRDATPEDFVAATTHDGCEVLVVGGGIAGLRAARLLAEAGRAVVLVDDRATPGGVAAAHVDRIDGQPVAEWVAAECAALAAAGGRLLSNTTANGIFDQGSVQLLTRHGFARAPSLCLMRAGRIVLATGSVDRPLVFDDNDRPGVMSAGAALDYAARFGAMAGRRIAVLGPGAEATAERLRQLGTQAFAPAGDPATARALGHPLRALAIGGQRHACDTILSTAGPVPQVQLWCQAGGALLWDADSASFRPGAGPASVSVIGTARGQTTPEGCLDDARRLARDEAPGPCEPAPRGLLPTAGSGRRWIDLQNDVTAKDVALAARENFRSVEHLKRYTTLGMGTDQGRISNVNGLALMAEATGRPVPEVGTTRFRPPYTPVELEVYRGIRRGQRLRPLKRTPLEAEHRAMGAAMGEYGGWLRAAWYGPDAAQAIRTEALRTRRTAGISDATPLGKIEVLGPDAADFLNFVYYNTVSTLKEGAIRYAFMLTEHGTLYDDGVLARLGAHHFLVSCSSSHADGVAAHLEGWRQDGHDPDRIFIHDVTQAWATLAVAGPEARALLSALDLGVELSAAAFPHMALRLGRFQDQPARIARVSFTGETSYEISVPSCLGPALWQRLLALGAPLGAGPLGMEAQAILRAEKGYLIVGKDTDGETMPQDLGVDAPLRLKTTPYVGDRGLRMPVAQAAERRHLVGLAVAPGQPRLPDGAHILRPTATGPASDGFVTSSYDSPGLGTPIALASLRNGRARLGETVTLSHLGATMTATVVAPCVFDPEGVRLHA